MTKKLYVAFRLSNDSYFCPHYKLNAYEEKLMNGIKDTIQNSSDDFVHLAETQLHYLTILPNNSLQTLHTTH